MIEKVIIDGKEVELTADLFEISPADMTQHEAITRPSLTFWQDARKRLFRNKGAITGLVILSIICFLTVFGPLFNKFTYDQQNLSHSKLPPRIPVISSLGVMDGTKKETSYDGKVSKVDVYERKGLGDDVNYWFGTDDLGRDLWTRTWSGARVSLFIAILAAVYDLLIGVTYGGVSAYYGGKVDMYMQRFIEILTGIPSLVILTLFILVFEPGVLSMSLAMAISGWTSMSRIVRSHVLRIKNQEFVLASRTLGASDKKIIIKHLFPNIIGPVVVMMMFSLPNAIFYEAFLSFIGLGLQPPYASLGVLINDGFKQLHTNPYMMFIPSVVICLLIFSLNLLADGLRDAVDPKMRNQ